MTQIFQRVLDKSLEKNLDRRESTSEVDKSSNFHDNSTQSVRSPSPNPDNTAQGYGKKRASFN